MVVGEYYLNGTYYIVAYLDNASNTASSSTTYLPQLFGSTIAAFPYNYIGTGYATTAWSGSPLTGWWFFDGVVAFVALYPGASNVGSLLISNGVFNMANQQQSSVPGFAVDYPPNGVEPIVVGAFAATPLGMSVLLPSQLGIINYAVHIAHPTTPLGTSALVPP